MLLLPPGTFCYLPQVQRLSPLNPGTLDQNHSHHHAGNWSKPIPLSPKTAFVVPVSTGASSYPPGCKPGGASSQESQPNISLLPLSSRALTRATPTSPGSGSLAHPDSGFCCGKGTQGLDLTWVSLAYLCRLRSVCMVWLPTSRVPEPHFLDSLGIFFFNISHNVVLPDQWPLEETREPGRKREPRRMKG